MGNVFLLCLQLPRPSSRPITSSGVFLCQWRRLVGENQKLKRKDNKKREKKNGNMTWYGAVIDPAAPHLSLLHLWCLFPSAQLLKCVRKKERVFFSLQQQKSSNSPIHRPEKLYYPVWFGLSSKQTNSPLDYVHVVTAGSFRRDFLVGTVTEFQQFSNNCRHLPGPPFLQL